MGRRLIAEAKGVKMANPKLSEPDIEALVNYPAEESRNVK